jgi:hypothetical protein
MPTGPAHLPDSPGLPGRSDSIRQLLAGDVEEIPLDDLPATLGRVEELAARIRLRIALASAATPAHAEEDQEISVADPGFDLCRDALLHG